MAQETNISPAEIVAQLKDSQPIKSSLSADSQVPGQWQREQEAINQPDRLGVRGKAFSASMTREAYGKDQSVCRADLLLMDEGGEGYSLSTPQSRDRFKTAREAVNAVLVTTLAQEDNPLRLKQP